MLPHLKSQESFLVRSNPRLARLLAQNTTGEDRGQIQNGNSPQLIGVPQASPGNRENGVQAGVGRSAEESVRLVPCSSSAHQQGGSSLETRQGLSLAGVGSVTRGNAARGQLLRERRYHPYPVALLRQPGGNPCERSPSNPMINAGSHPAWRMSVNTPGALPGLNGLADGFPPSYLSQNALNHGPVLKWDYLTLCTCHYHSASQLGHRPNNVMPVVKSNTGNGQDVCQSEERCQKNRERRNAVFNETVASCAQVPELAGEVHLFWQYVRLLEGDGDERKEAVRLIDEVCAKRFTNCLISTAKFHPNYARTWHPIPADEYDKQLDKFYEEMKSQLQRRRDQVLGNKTIVAGGGAVTDVRGFPTHVSNRSPVKPKGPKLPIKPPDTVARTASRASEEVGTRAVAEGRGNTLSVLRTLYDEQELLAAISLSSLRSPQNEDLARCLRHSPIPQPALGGSDLTRRTKMLPQQHLQWSPVNVPQGNGMGHIRVSNLPPPPPPIMPTCLPSMWWQHCNLTNNVTMPQGQNSRYQPYCSRGQDRRNQVLKGTVTSNTSRMPKVNMRNLCASRTGTDKVASPTSSSSPHQSDQSGQSPLLQQQPDAPPSLPLGPPVQKFARCRGLNSREPESTSPPYVPQYRRPVLEVTREWVNSLPEAARDTPGFTEDNVNESDTTPDNFQSGTGEDLAMKLSQQKGKLPEPDTTTGVGKQPLSKKNSKIIELLITPCLNKATAQRDNDHLEKLLLSEEKDRKENDENGRK